MIACRRIEPIQINRQKLSLHGAVEYGLDLFYSRAIIKAGWLENTALTRQTEHGTRMKRILTIACCLSVLFAGIAAAWADCKQISLSDRPRKSLPHVAAHDHHSDSHREHSQGTVIHCPTLEDFLVTAIFSVGGYDREQPVHRALVAHFHSRVSQNDSYRLVHGPPGLDYPSIIPPYLLLSVLLI
jgi:hypothetical protein